VDEALDDPAAFFSTCGRPLYLSGDLLFDVDQHTLQPTARPVLHRMVRLLKEAPDEARILVITGHTDPRGEGPHNEALSLRRAETVAAFVADNGGVRRNTLVVEGKGEREPIVPESAPLQQQRFNRRVEISVRCPGGG
jgi:outer membrane protein OmpA-like peptidoglycan-associated protein